MAWSLSRAIVLITTANDTNTSTPIISVNSNGLAGWTSSPNTRGTIDIIWSCVLVLFTCAWTVIHVNVPAHGEGYSTLLARKLRWCIFAIAAPELLSTVAACQWASSRATAHALQARGYKHWTVVHSFYAESGGFHLHTPDFVSFPVNARGIFYLVKMKYIELPSLTRDDIEDRSKADKFAKCVAVAQTTYLIVNIIARLVESLAITPLEVVAVAFIPNTLATYYFWMDKPFDIGKVTALHSTTSIRQILIDAGELGKAPYRDTPLDFVERSEYAQGPGWNVWARQDFFAHFGNLSTRPIQRIPNDYVVPPHSLGTAIPLWGLGALHGAIHLAGWNCSFPTTAESYIWRISGALVTGILTLQGFQHLRSTRPDYNFRVEQLGLWVRPAGKPGWYYNYAVHIPSMICAVLYSAAKMAIVGGAWASLRLLPVTAYMNVSWTGILPHF